MFHLFVADDQSIPEDGDNGEKQGQCHNFGYQVESIHLSEPKMIRAGGILFGLWNALPNNLREANAPKKLSMGMLANAAAR
jgi:hypothetical protein